MPTSKTTSHGEWRILIKSSKFHAVNSQIRQKWDEWCKPLPKDIIMDVPDNFPEPAIMSKNVKSMNNEEDASVDSYGTLLSTTSTLTHETMGDNAAYFDVCPLDDNLPSYAQVLTGNQYAPSPASTITPSVQNQSVTNAESNLHSIKRWEEENHKLQQQLREQEARIQELDSAKLTLNQRLEQIMEEVQSKECRSKELENTIAKLLSVVADRDQQMAERDHQFEIRNRQFDALMERLTIHENHNQSNPDYGGTTLGGTVSQKTPETPARSNKRQNTLPTPERANGGEKKDTRPLKTFPCKELQNI